MKCLLYTLQKRPLFFLGVLKLKLTPRELSIALVDELPFRWARTDRVGKGEALLNPFGIVVCPDRKGRRLANRSL